ncbi:MAG TPA: ABC transporter ATP-binding protein [Chloroflexota bacterium]|jgi:ABC-2 type transport system ATP-binding protein
MIRADGLRRVFGTHVAVDDVSLSVPDGAILALLGPNGAGKTTTVRMLAGLLAPTAGKAEVAGRDVRQDPAAVRARVGLVTESPGLHDQMTPVDYLDFFGQVYGLDRATRRERIDRLLTQFELQSAKHKRMASFSRGMQQKIALARALLHEPAAVFLDEPTASLDPLAARVVRDLIVGLKNASRSIILCTHDLDEAERLADTVAILRHGRVVACDTPAALRSAASLTTFVRIRLAAQCATALEVVADMPEVQDATLDVSGSTLEFRVMEPERTNPQVIARLVAHGAQVVSVTHSTATLEDVFRRAVTSESAA